MTHDHGDDRYLAAKRTVDDRCVNRRVRDRLLAAVVAGPAVYDAGAGTGVWLARLVEWGVGPDTYHGVDTDAALLETARTARAEAFAARGTDVDTAAEEFDFRAGNTDVRFTAGDALAGAPDGGVDLLLAGSFLDLVPVEEAIDRFAAATAANGVVYAPATFDSGTFFAPTHPADDVVERLYHADIDRTPGRSVTAGRDAMAAFRARPGELLAVGSSDWVVSPDETGYPNDEAYFLDRILGYVADTLLAPSVERLSRADADAELSAFAREEAPGEAAAIRDWLHARREAFEARELAYVAHHLDLLYRPASDE